MRKLVLLFLLIQSDLLTFSQTVWTNVVTHGADPSGKVKCTEVINSNIDSLAASGGGTLFFPSGTFLTGPIVLKSNITLYLDAGAVIKFSDDFDDYLPMVQSSWEGVRVKNFKSQVYAYQCENISIKGSGHFEGQGKKWWDFMRMVNSGKKVDNKWQQIFGNENKSLLSRNSYIAGKKNFLRPPMLTVYECRNVLIEGVSFSNPPFWTIMPAFSDNITISGITIVNPGNSPNTDGIDPSSCRNVHITNCHISVGDDCIVIKSGRDEDGREAGRPTENITISNCTMLEGHGGVVIGSEMSGGVRRITISNCVFEGTDIGIRIKTMRGRGGVVEDIRVSNIAMFDIVNEGVLVTLRYQQTRPEPLSERTPVVRNVQLSNINIRNATRPAAVYGLPEKYASEISFNDIRSFSKKGILLENAENISFHDMRMEVSEGIPLEATDSKGLTWDMVSVINPPSELPIIKLANCQDVWVGNCFQPGATKFITEDDRCKNIYLINNVLPSTSLPGEGSVGKIIIGKNVTGNSHVAGAMSPGVDSKWSVRMANTVMTRSDSLVYYVDRNPKWAYDVAFLGMAIDRLGEINPGYSRYMKDWVDYFVRPDGSVKDYRVQEYNLDRILPGRNVITLYQRDPQKKYKIAIDGFIGQLKSHPKTNSGGYWHKKIYPWQMWLDGIFMGSTFMAQYAREFNAPGWYDVAASQTKMIYEKTLDPASGLLMHAWDESRQQKWCDPGTGKSHYPWSRATGWYTMAIIDILDNLPSDHPDREILTGMLRNICSALLKVRDPETGLWYQVLDQGGREGNYIEASGSAMFAYVFARGAHRGYLDGIYLDVAGKSFDSLIKNLITVDQKGLLTLHNICGGCGLGGNPYRDGSYEYYINEKRIDNDPKGVAPFIMAAIELDR